MRQLLPLSTALIVASLTLLTLPSTAPAALITTQTSFSEGFSIPNNSQSDSATSTGAAITLSNTFSSSSSTGLQGGGGVATGVTNNAATATAAFDASGFHMGASASGDVTVSGNLPGGYLYTSTALGYVEFSDLVTVQGGTTGTPGFLRLTFDVDGTFAAAASSTWQLVSGASLTLHGGYVGIGSGVSQLLYAELVAVDSAPGGSGTTSRGVPVPDLLVVDFATTLGEPLPLQLQLFAQFGAQFSRNGSGAGTAGAGNGSGSVDFASTFTLLSAQALDANLNLIAGGSVISQDGSLYPSGGGGNGGGAPLPIPPGLVLVGGGLAGLVVARRLFKHEAVG